MHLIGWNCYFLPWWQPSADNCGFYIAPPQKVAGEGKVKVKSGRCKVKVKSVRTHGPQEERMHLVGLNSCSLSWWQTLVVFGLLLPSILNWCHKGGCSTLIDTCNRCISSDGIVTFFHGGNPLRTLLTFTLHSPQSGLGGQGKSEKLEVQGESKKCPHTWAQR